MGTGSWQFTETLPTPAHHARDENPQWLLILMHITTSIIPGPTPGTADSDLLSQHPYISVSTQGHQYSVLPAGHGLAEYLT